MLRKEKPRKRQQFHRNDDDFQPKRKRKIPKQKNRHLHVWIEEETEDELPNRFFSFDEDVLE